MPPPVSGAAASQDVAVSLWRRAPCGSLPIATVTLLTAGETVSRFPPGITVYTEADAERLAVIIRGLLRAYMHTSDGRQVTVRYVRAGHLLGAPALVGGPAPVFVQALTESVAYFMDVPLVRRVAQHDASVAWVLAEESVHRLYDVLEELAGNTFATVRQRVVRHLLDLAASRPATPRRPSAVV